MSEEEFLRLFNTMGFNNGIVKEVRLINPNAIYIVMFDGPDLIFEYHDLFDWSLQTVKNFVRKGDTNESVINSENCI